VRNPFSVLFERRNIGPQDVLNMLLRGSQSSAGVSVTESSALNVAAVWTGLQIRSSLLSTLPLDVIESMPDGRSRERRPNHPAARLLYRPNVWQTQAEFLGMLEVHRILRGNAFAWKNFAHLSGPSGFRRRVVEMIPIHPDRIDVTEPDEIGGQTKYVLHRTNGEPLPLPAHEVFHVKNMSTNGRTGRPFLTDLRETLGGSIALQQHANSLWSNDATPSVTLSHPGKLSKPAKNNLEESWEAIYGRGKDKRRVAVLEEGMTLSQLSLTPDDGQFLQTKQDLRSEIAAALQVPEFMMGLASKQTSWGTGIEQQQIGVLVFTLTPSIVGWEQRLDRDLLETDDARITDPLSPFSFKFNVNGLRRGDMKSQAESFWKYRQMGVYNANDIRRMLDENPIPNGEPAGPGDVYLQPANFAPLGSDPEPDPQPVSEEP
jgi:HK97 family phage portal protein